jgi:hypothetical protein
MLVIIGAIVFFLVAGPVMLMIARPRTGNGITEHTSGLASERESAGAWCAFARP